jgi:hypothetical protein
MMTNGSLIPNEKNMVPSINEARYSIFTHKRGSYSIFTKESHPQAYISQSYQEHSYTSHEHHKQGHNLISSIS